MLAIYWEPKSAFQNTFCRYSTISKHNNSTTVKPSGHLSLRHSWAPVTVPEALPALRLRKMPLIVRYLSGIFLVFIRDFTGILPVFVRDPVPRLTRTSPGAPDRTENTFYRICHSFICCCFHVCVNQVLQQSILTSVYRDSTFHYRCRHVDTL